MNFNHHQDDTGGLLALFITVILMVFALAGAIYVFPKILQQFFP